VPYRFALVVSKYNEFVTDRLQAGALEVLTGAGVAASEVTIVRVPGAFELPLAAQHAAESGRFDAIVCLGCVIRGETPHFEYICSAVAHGLTAAAAATGIPMANKGREAAVAALEMADVVARLVDRSAQKP